jgi:rfaE bifunctional protein kinase chain/domain
MNARRCREITAQYPALRIGVVGDFCLDRYLEIDTGRRERSIETGRPVHNVARIRSQPGGAGTIVNNLAALGVGTIHCVGFCGADGEGWELQRALAALPGVRLDHFFATPERHTFTYTKPMLGARELSRLDLKNWSPTSRAVQRRLAASVATVAAQSDFLVVLEQTDAADTGVCAPLVRTALAKAARQVPVLADSRRCVADFRGAMWKMNAAEFRRLTRRAPRSGIAALAAACGKKVFVTLAADGLLGATPEGDVWHIPALPRRGKIDVVGAGDAVTANLAAALAAGADVREALALANVAASVVIHQLGTTGAASVRDLRAGTTSTR